MYNSNNQLKQKLYPTFIKTSKVCRTCFDHLHIPHGIARCATGLLRLLVLLIAVSCLAQPCYARPCRVRYPGFDRVLLGA